MKKSTIFAAFAALVMAFASCKKVEAPSNLVSVNGTSVENPECRFSMHQGEYAFGITFMPALDPETKGLYLRDIELVAIVPSANFGKTLTAASFGTYDEEDYYSMARVFLVDMPYSFKGTFMVEQGTRPGWFSISFDLVGKLHEIRGGGEPDLPQTITLKGNVSKLFDYLRPEPMPKK